MDTVPVLIAGGGIAGLAAALAAARHGEVLLLEREAAFSEFGAGLQLGPNAVRALQAIGAWEAVAPVTTCPPAIQIRDGTTGRLLRRLALGSSFETRFGAPYRVAHRADLHGVLLSLVKAHPRITVETGVAVENFAADQAIVTINDGAYRSRLLLAADGVGSRIRQQLFPGSSAVDSGLVFRRALLKTAKAETDLACVTLWLCPGGHVVHYPVGADRRLNIVHVVPSASTVSTRLHVSLADLLKQVPGWTDWPGRHAPPLPSWSLGPVALIGDAAHGTLPFLAQGAAMALEDAAALRHDPHDLSPLLARQERVSRLHRATLAAGRNYHLGGAAASLRNAAISLMPDSLFLSRLAWIYGYSP